MGLQGLDHYTVCVTNLNASVQFYEEVLALKSGPRPNFGFPGAWLYLNDKPVVHLIAERESDTKSTGPVDHIAFRGTGVDDTVRVLEENSMEYRRNEIEDFGLTQLFIRDPDGVMVELNFEREEA